jgi:hypothetical protein
VTVRFLRQLNFETPPSALNGESKFRLRLRGGRRRFALTSPEHFQLGNALTAETRRSGPAADVQISAWKSVSKTLLQSRKL